MEATDDWVQYVIDKPMAKDPGTVFNYSSGATELLAYIFKKATGQDIDAYGEKYLFAPLGIKHHWKRTYLGVVDTEGGLYLTGADLAKLGYLYLRGGVWAGKRIVAEDWVKRSTTSHVDTGLPGMAYGFKWWLYDSKNSGQPVWMGLGIGGQRLFVFPDTQLIATLTGWDILKAPTLQAELDLVNRLLPAVRVGTCQADSN
jgi:CubicO group peptidase (beta-lactamase class C family)